MSAFIESHHYLVEALFFLAVMAMNIPIGRLRSRFPKFSRPWARCIYIPVTANIVLRRAVGLTYKAIPIIILAVVIGQVLGGRLFKGAAAEEGPAGRARLS